MQLLIIEVNPFMTCDLMGTSPYCHLFAYCHNSQRNIEEMSNGTPYHI